MRQEGLEPPESEDNGFTGRTATNYGLLTHYPFGLIELFYHNALDVRNSLLPTL